MAAKTYSNCSVTAFSQVARTAQTQGQQQDRSLALQQVIQQKFKQRMFAKPVSILKHLTEKMFPNFSRWQWT